MKGIQKLVRLGMIVGTLAITALPTFGQIYGVVDGKDVTVRSAHADGGQFEIEDENGISYVEAEAVQIYKVKGEVAIDGATLRKLPHPESGVLTTLGEGVSINVMGQKGNWYEVVLADGTKGYMYSSQVLGECLPLLPEIEVEMQASVEVVQWSEASKIVPRGAVVTIEDVYTGKKFQIKRTFGTNHADVEALTKADTQMVKQIWGGYSWERRPVIVHVNGRRLAASMAGMPHAGDTLDAVKGNGMSGVMDLHFKGSRKHKDGNISATVDPLHQKAIQIAAQYKG